MDAVTTLTGKAQTALANNAAFLALPHPVTNAQALAQVDALTRQMNAVIRLVLLRQFNDLSDT